MTQRVETHQSKFTIDLADSRAPRAFRDKHNLWGEELDRIYRLIGWHVEILEKDKKAEKLGVGREAVELPHLSVAVFGPSGSGKSSLIRTLVDDIDRKPRGRLLPEHLEGKIASLPVIDPTTWSNSEQFLYAFLALALETEREHQEKKEHGYPQGLTPVQLAFQEVNEYLRVVDDPSIGGEHDPLGLSLQKLERHTSGLRLRKALERFVDALANELGSEVVILPVDDLDMAPSHLVSSLQAYQSFLNHPRLLPVFTFTDRMPEELIEVHYERSLGDGGKNHPGKMSGEQLNINQKLAVQFLARCFPVRNRIKLGPAPARVQRAIYTISSRRKLPKNERGESMRWGGDDHVEESENIQVLELLLTSSFLLFGFPDKEDAHKVRAALRPSTLRRQLQVVDAMNYCELGRLRVPQLAYLADPETDPDVLHELATFGGLEELAYPKKKGIFPRHKNYRLRNRLWVGCKGPAEDSPEAERFAEHKKGYLALAKRLGRNEKGATWATVFSGATWSLLNVHRDTLRELGLYLEDLYSWSPKELRTVVLDRILVQDRVTRRTVIDRWFNRTDYRRSQVLSLLAANIFRPWMNGEEPYGDEELPIRTQSALEATESEKKKKGKGNCDDVSSEELLERVSFSSTHGLLWFLNITLGFYLPQAMAHNWTEALSPEEPVKGRMSGNGWDLKHAPINAVRVADARQEIFSFGTIFLDPRGYRHALEAWAFDGVSKQKMKVYEGWQAEREKLRAEILKASDQSMREALRSKILENDQKMEGFISGELKAIAWKGKGANKRGNLMLRLWSCCGYSRGRYWAAFSFWRGLGFIGQILELGLEHREAMQIVAGRICKGDVRADTRKRIVGDEWPEEENLESADKELKAAVEGLLREVKRLIRSHCLANMVPGSLLDRDSSEERLLQGFPRWEVVDFEDAIEMLARELIYWLAVCWEDSIFPFPAGYTWIGWRDCFIRRVHGEYVLGGLWPRLNAAYLEEHQRYECQELARRRCYSEERIWTALEDQNLEHGENFRWSAAVAAGAWSDHLLDYWRGCPPILRLLLTCPVFPKSHERFGPSLDPENGEEDWEVAKRVYQGLFDGRESSGSKAKSKRPKEEKELRREWLERLSLPQDFWQDLLDNDWLGLIRKKNGRGRKKKEEPQIPGLIPSEFCVERVRIDLFSHRPVSRHSVSIENTKATIKKGDDVERRVDISPEPPQYPPDPAERKE